MRSELADVAARDIRAALSFGSRDATDDISRTAKQESGTLFALRDGQVQDLSPVLLRHSFCKPLCAHVHLSVSDPCVGYWHQQADITGFSTE